MGAASVHSQQQKLLQSCSRPHPLHLQPLQQQQQHHHQLLLLEAANLTQLVLHLGQSPQPRQQQQHLVTASLRAV
jgi:hypothetical protein